MAWGARGRPPDGRLISPRRSRPRQRSSVGAICAGVTRTRNSSRHASRGGVDATPPRAIFRSRVAGPIGRDEAGRGARTTRTPPRFAEGGRNKMNGS